MHMEVLQDHSSTGDVLKAVIQTIGLKKGSCVVSSIFLMSFEDDDRVQSMETAHWFPILMLNN